MIRLNSDLYVDPDAVTHVRQNGLDAIVHFTSGRYVTLQGREAADVAALLDPHEEPYVAPEADSGPSGPPTADADPGDKPAPKTEPRSSRSW